MKKLIIALLIFFSFTSMAIITQNAIAQNQYRSQIMNRTEVRASHILVPTEQEALALKKQIENEEITFEKAASLYSKCPSSRNGGDLGYFTRGQMVKPFEDAAFALQLNEVSAPVQTSFGYHLIKVTGIR